MEKELVKDEWKEEINLNFRSYKIFSGKNQIKKIHHILAQFYWTNIGKRKN